MSIKTIRAQLDGKYGTGNNTKMCSIVVSGKIFFYANIEGNMHDKYKDTGIESETEKLSRF